MTTLRGVLAAMLAQVAMEAWRRWGWVEAGAEVERALAEWLVQTVDLVCLLLAAALRARGERRKQRDC